MNFRITEGKGFHIKFKNGVTLSTQFGFGNYCDNRHIRDNIHNGETGSNLVEVAVWDKDKKWLTRKMIKAVFNEEAYDDVMGYVNVTDWAKIVQWCSEQDG